MYDRSAEFYDAIYSFKNYEKETAKLHELIQQHKRSPGNELLDVACGTGGHISYLKRNYSVEGLDNSPRMLRLARKKHPDVVFHRRDMTNFTLRKEFDVVTCLFSSVGHVKTRRRLDLAVLTMARHLKPGVPIDRAATEMRQLLQGSDPPEKKGVRIEDYHRAWEQRLDRFGDYVEQTSDRPRR